MIERRKKFIKKKRQRLPVYCINSGLNFLFFFLQGKANTMICDGIERKQPTTFFLTEMVENLQLL